MSKRLLCSIAFLCIWSGVAHAELSVDPDPIAFGSRSIAGAAHTIDETVTTDQAVAENYDQIVITGTGCAGVVAVTPTSGVVDVVDGADITIAFDPVERTTVSCVVDLQTSGGASLGTFTVTGTGTAPELGAPASVAFGSERVTVAGATSTQGIVLENTGNEQLDISSITISGSDYAITTNPAPATVQPGMSVTVQVTFDPTASGTRTADLVIASNDPASPSTVELTGEGTNAVIRADDVVFGAVTHGTSSTLDLAVNNIATAPVGPLRVTSAVLGGGSWFSFGGTCSGTSCTIGQDVTTTLDVPVVCAPPANASGMQQAMVTFTHDGDSGDAVALLTCTAGRADIAIDPTALAFGDIVVGDSAIETIIVTNTGNEDLTFSVAKTGTHEARYTLGGCFSSCTVQPGTMQTFSVTFAPDQVANMDISLAITSNDPDTSPLAVAVTGNGVRPEITGPASVAFGDVELGKPETQTLTITNTGTSALTITSAAVQTGTADYTATGTAGTQVVAAGATASWSVACDPQAQGPRPGTFRIVSDAQNTPTLDVPLTCNGTRGHLVVDPTSLAFGGVPEDTTTTLDVTLRNTGNLAVTSITASVNPTTAGYSVVAATLPSSLAAGAMATVTIQFAPTATATGGDATVTFAGEWGTTPTQTAAPLALTGSSLVNGITVSTASIDFGDFRYDLTPARTFCITNSGESNVTVLSPIVFTPTNMTASSEFAVTQVARKSTCGGAATVVTLPQTLAPGDILEVTVRAQPANRTGPLTGNLTISTDLPTNATRTVALAGNAITAMLTVVPGATVDMGEVDIQGGAPVQATVRLRNTGAAPLDLAAFTRTANDAFTFTLPSDTTIAPAGEISFVVTYAPTVASASPETVTITHAIDGDINAPAMGMIVLSGRGLDRDLQILDPLPVFPDTFRNPGSAGPVRNVSIHNLGTAPLQIASITSTDPAVWKVLDPEAIAIPPNATLDVRVRFEPTAPGISRARLQIVNDDDDDGPPITNKTTEVNLEGNCITRNVRLDPSSINVGYVEVGETITLPRALIVTSMDLAHTFTIQKIAIDGGDGAFSLAGTIDGLELDNMTPERRFDVTFTPQTAGPFVAKAQLFLDEDPLVQAEIELVGTAVFVEARGGGGCATSDGAGLAMLALVLAFVLRRRAAVVVLVIAPLVARADDNILLSVFDPLPATTSDNFHLQSAVVGGHGAWAANAVFSYAQDPLLHLGTPGGEHGVITGSSRLELGAAVALLDKFELGASMPFYSQSGEALGDPQMEYTADPADGTATGDLRIFGKVGIVKRALAGNGLFALGGSVALTIPTATDGMLTGGDNPTARMLGLVSLVPGAFENRITLTANAGAVIRAPAEYKNLEQKSGVAWGLGTTVRIADPLWLAAEVFGELSPSGRAKMDGSTTVLSPIEWLGGVRWRPDHRFTISIAAGRGLTSAAGSPALRGVVALTVTPRADAIKPIRAARDAAPDVDSDGDGVFDRADGCDNEPEDADLFDDGDGCPDPDNDRDGIADAGDRCALEPEDKDNYDDEDGCVDKDNDRDGIVDAMDKCPGEAEDKDGFRDADGCGEPDNDGDGIVDAKDRCANQRESINGNQDEDGCPDPGFGLVVLTPDRIDLMEAVQFQGAKLSKTSFNLLGQIAATLRAHPEVLRVRIGVHVAAGRDEERDLELSEQRGQAIREWLVEWGIAESRLDVRGFGSTKPLGGARMLDNRVELVIMERK